MNHARAERAALSDLFARLGPDAPTLCEGWTTFDLAAHLVLRESRPDALGGILLAPLAGYTASVQESMKARHGYDGLVELVRSGPGGIYRLIPGLDQVVNTTEYFIHHEDVRRAQRVWEPRELPADLEQTFWKQVRAGNRVFLRKSPARVVMHRIGGGVAIGGPGDAPQVEVTGRAGELLLFCFGRQAHARVDVSGDEQAVARLMDAPLGV
ncbi:TIGR03085 family metal-binding protein [Streptosporangium fragile]|uniref:TIGR03085 family metal-binding protein n=1 Tax=Streptosporangium fragile TaxID=46186 RepID=A0ABN3VQR5_9ACTN